MALAELITKFGVTGLQSLKSSKDDFFRLVMDTFGPLPQAIEDRFPVVGKEFHDMYKTAKDKTRIKFGKINNHRQYNLNDLTEEQYDRVAKALDGQTQAPISGIEANAYNTDRAILDSLKKYNEEAGVDARGYLEHYFPQFTKDPDSIIRPGPDREFQIQKWMKETGRTRVEIERAMNQQLSNSIRVKRYGPLDYGRELKYSNEVRRWDKEVVRDYMEGATRRGVFAKTFGPNNEIISQMAEKIPDYNERLAFINAANTLLGIPGPRTLESVWQGGLADITRSAIVRSMMSFSAMSNSMQGVYGATVKTNLTSTAKAIASYWSGADEEFLRKAGIINRSLESAFDEYAKDSKFLSKTFFPQTEIASRSIAALAEKFYVQSDLVPALQSGSKAAFREAVRLGLNPKKLMAGKASEDDLLKAAVRMVDETQFLDSSRELPIFANNPLGKILYTLWGFNIHWANFVRTYAIDELKHGNPLPMAKLIGTGYMVGMTNRAVWNTLGAKDKEKENSILNPLDNLLYSGGFGIVSDSIQSARMGRPFMPPALSLVGDALTSTYKAVGKPIEEGRLPEMNDIRSLAKFMGRRVLVPGVIGALPQPVALAGGVATRMGLEKFLKKDGKYEGMTATQKRIKQRRDKRINRLQKLREKRG